MSITNPTNVLTEALAFPQAFEANFTGAPVLSSKLSTLNGKLPALPNLPVALPDLPAPPALPKLGIELPGGGSLAPPKPNFTKVTDFFQVIPPRAVSVTPGGGTAAFLQTGKSTFTYK